ncbi:hypothetical protein LZC95_19955 [Pendulispora brunnea]|uniref:Uncharacterized protein n=1 Tax=Pendulispora brunnea TaxID=2905690 RepID=A0ABZ2KPZ0_9BACT
MAGQSTFDEAPPRRPGLSTFNGAAKADDAEFPPDPKTMPSAAEYNALCRLVIAYGKVVPVAIVDVAFTGGAASVQRFVAAGSHVTTASFTVQRTGPGDTDVLWPEDAFPAPVVDADATITEDVDVDRVRVFPRVSPPAGTRGVTVRTRLGAAGVDARFQLRIY